MGKFEDLDKLQKLKENGVLTEEEFEQQKQNILNQKNIEHKKFKISKLFFIFTAFFVMITIGTFIYKNSCEEKYRDYMSQHMSDDIALKNRKITKTDYQHIQNMKDRYSKKEDISKIIFYVSTGITVVFIITDIIFVVIEKKRGE